MKEISSNLEVLIPVDRPDNHTFVCSIPGTRPMRVTLRRSLEEFKVVLDVTCTIGAGTPNEQTVRVHRSEFTKTEIDGWYSLERSWMHARDVKSQAARKLAVGLLRNVEFYPEE